MLRLLRAGLGLLLPLASLVAPAAASDNEQAVQSISGSSQRSISGSSQRSISGSSQRSISGSSQRSISGSSQRSISGSSQRSISGSSQRSLSDLVVLGPVTGFGEYKIEVAGQVFRVDNGSLAPDSLSQVAYVTGDERDGEFVASAVTLFDDYSVPGSSIVLVAGRIEAVDQAAGTITIGGIKVDVASLDINADVGDSVAIAGTQPLLGGLILAQSVSPLDGTLIRNANVDASDLVSIE